MDPKKPGKKIKLARLEVNSMIKDENKQILIKIPDALKIVGIIGGTLGIFVVLLSTIAYLPEHPNFSILTTYLSDIGDTEGWPQILFNSGTLIAAPIRYLIIVLVAFRLSELGAGRAFVATSCTHVTLGESQAANIVKRIKL